MIHDATRDERSMESQEEQSLIVGSRHSQTPWLDVSPEGLNKTMFRNLIVPVEKTFFPGIGRRLKSSIPEIAHL